MYHGKCSLIHSAGSFKTTEKTTDIIKGILKIPSVWCHRHWNEGEGHIRGCIPTVCRRCMCVLK